MIIPTPKVVRPTSFDREINRITPPSQNKQGKGLGNRDRYRNNVLASTEHSIIFREKTEISWTSDFSDQERDGLEPLEDVKIYQRPGNGAGCLNPLLIVRLAMMTTLILLKF